MDADALINSLINRLGSKLSTLGTGGKAEAYESDPLVSQTVRSLIDLSQYKVQVTIRALLNLLESSLKNGGEEFVSADNMILQSFILKVINLCLGRHWTFCLDPTAPSSRSINNNSVFDENNNDKEEDNISIKSGRQPFDMSNNNNNPNLSHRSSVVNFNSHFDYATRVLEDPPPLDEALATSLMKIVFQFLHIAFAGDIAEGFLSLSVNSNGTSMSKNERSPIKSLKTSSDVRAQIQMASSSILKYISASNWTIIFARFKSRLSLLSNTNDEGLDLGDLRYLEWCNLNEKRLSTLLQELGVSFLQMKRPAQLAFAFILRSCIWNWIEAYPLCFIALHKNQKRLEGGPEVLFDICNSLADNTRKKTAFWPLQVMLLTLCPDVLSSIVNGNSPSSKKAQFFENLRKTLKGKSMAEVAAIAYVDLCKASTYLANVEGAALKQMIPDIESELKEKLFDPMRPFLTSDNVIDQKLMTDCLTAFFRLNANNAMQSLIPICLKENVPIAFKLVLVKSCYNIASETYLPWNPTIESMYSTLAGPMRKLFQQNLILDRTDLSTAVIPTDKKARKLFMMQIEETNEKMEILMSVLRVYRSDPMLAIIGHTPETQYNENSQLLHNITICLKDPNPTIRTCAAEALLELHDPSLIEKWGPPETMMESFWSCSSTIVTDLSRQILDYKAKDDGVKYFVEVLYQILLRRVKFIELHKDKIHKGIQVPERLVSLVALEVAMLVMLCMPDSDICSQATFALGLICKELELTKEHNDPEDYRVTLYDNKEPYSQISKAGLLVTGRVAQQKSIRKVLRLIQTQTFGCLAAWEEVYKRWRNLKSIATTPPDETPVDFFEQPKKKTNFFNTNRTSTLPPTKEKENQEKNDHKKQLELWQNYTGFLCALGGICIVSEERQKEIDKIKEDCAKKKINLYFRGKIPKKPTDSNAIVNRFIMEMVELLICESPLARETVKEVSGAELNPAIYGNLFRHLESIVGRFFSADGEVNCNDSYTMFVEQAISVLKLILDRLNENAEYIFAVDLDMGNLLSSFSRYLNHADNSATSLRVKVKMCQLTEILMIKKDLVSLRREFHIRNKLLESMVEWTSDFAKTTDLGGLEDNSDKLFRDLDLAIMKTVVLLLEGLPLLAQDAKTEAERTEAKSKLFYKYFSYFIKLLNRCRILETIEVGSHSIKDNSDLMNLLSKSKESLKDLGPLKDCTILALSNLLSANIEYGLKYSLSMGYHEDTKTRSAFMQVLTNILKQGTEFATLGQTTDKDRFQRIFNLFAEDDLTLAMSLCDVCPVSDVDDLSGVLLNLFDNLGITIKVLKAVIEKEIYKTDSSPELFRRNSMASRLLASFARYYGDEYLNFCLKPILDEMVNNSRSYEVDPSKIGAGSDAEANLANLKQMCQAFLDAIIESSSKIPSSLREICAYLAKVVVEKFPEANTTSVGGLMFLRFFCPAIVAPDIQGLTKTITDKDLRRGLLLITKVIQNLANNVFFGAKEAFMISLNDLLTEYIPKVTNYLIEISTVREGEVAQVNESVKLDDDDIARFHYYLVENVDRMGRDIATHKSYTAFPITKKHEDQASFDRAKSNAKASFQRLSILLAQLGTPEKQAKKKAGGPAPAAKTGDEAYKDFMTKNRKKDVTSVAEKKIFYEGGLSKERRPVFYFIARRLIADAIDLELLMLHIFLTLEKHVGKSYELLIDLTQFGTPNEMQPQHVNQFFSMVPSEVQSSISSIYFYNTNTAFQRYCKNLDRTLPFKFAKRTSFPSNLSELAEFIHQSDIKLPRLTIALEAELGIAFSPVNCITQSKQLIPSSIKVLQDTLQISMLKKQEVLGLSSYFNDVYHISQVDDVSISSYRDENGLVVKLDGGLTTMLLISPKIDLICKAIRNAKARYLVSKPAGIDERVIRPNNVPGTLLNMALLNSGSEDPNLRLASYNMLFALSSVFKFDAGNQLMIARDLCIPSNNTSFVLAISERLAVSEPQLTFEFLSECFVGIKNSTTPLKHLCLEYMAPWLSNLTYLSRNSALDAGGLHSRTRELLTLMFELTAKETEMAPSIQSKIWRTIGGVDELIDIVLDAIVQYAVEHGAGSIQAEILADTTVTLSAVNVRAGKLVSRLRKLISKTAINPKRILTEHVAWVEIAVLVRFNLMLSFNNRFIAQHYLPEVFHSVSILAASGPPIIRSSIHGLVINVIQSLCTCLPNEHPHLRTLSNLLAEFSEPKFRLLFGLNRVNINAFSRSAEANIDTNEPIPLSNLESIVHTLLDVISYGSISIDQSNIWRARWMSLVTSTAFQFNPAVQPRAFIVLGCLARGEVDDDLLYQILVALRGALELFDDSDCNLIVSIILCLSNILENLPEDSKYLQPMFWLAIAFVQIGHMPLVASAVKLLEVVVRRMNFYQLFEQMSPSSVFMKAREPFDTVSSKLDRSLGICFSTDFAFAFAAVFLRGLKQFSTKAATLNIFRLMMDITLKSNKENSLNPSILGYLAPQLPMAAKNGDLKELLHSVGLEDVEIDNNELNTTYFKLYHKLPIQDKVSTVLLIAMMAGLLQHAEFEAEYLFLYGFLAEASLANPEVFSLVQRRLVPKMTQVLHSNQTAAIIDAVQSILYNVISKPCYKGASPKDISLALEPLGFVGLLECAALPELQRDEILTNARLVGGLVESIIG